MPFRIGFTVDDRYVLRRRLYQGACNQVFAAWDQRDKRETVIKVAESDPKDRRRQARKDPTEDLDGAGDRDMLRLQREAVALATLAHPRIVRPVGSGFHAGAYYLALEMLEGVALDKVLENGQRMPLQSAVAVAAQALEALEAVHRAGLVHRDVKPGNLMMTSRGVVLIDFGLVTLAPHVRPRARRVTGEFHTVGTPSYMSPEQCAGDRRLDARSDLYAVGHVLYRSLTGLPTFAESGSVRKSLQNQRLAAPVPFAEAASELEIPGAVEAVVMKALEKDPDDRFRTAAEFREALLVAAP